MPNVFSDDFSILEHDGWSRVAELYDKSWGNLTKQFIDTLLEAVHIKPGMKVLDIACGPGYVSQNIFLRKGIPTGVDFSGAMIQLAKKLYPQIEFIEGDAQQLNFADAVYDCVVMNFGMLHLVKPEMAIAEACRVLKKGGSYGFTVWSGPDRSPAAKVMYNNIMKYADQNVGLPEAPDSYLFSDEQLCVKTLEAKGFEKVKYKNLDVKWIVPSAEYFFETEIKAGVRTASLLKRQTKETLTKIKAAVVNEMQQFYENGKYHLKFCGCIISAMKK